MGRWRISVTDARADGRSAELHGEAKPARMLRGSCACAPPAARSTQWKPSVTRLCIRTSSLRSVGSSSAAFGCSAGELPTDATSRITAITSWLRLRSVVSMFIRLHSTTVRSNFTPCAAPSAGGIWYTTTGLTTPASCVGCVWNVRAAARSEALVASSAVSALIVTSGGSPVNGTSIKGPPSPCWVAVGMCDVGLIVPFAQRGPSARVDRDGEDVSRRVATPDGKWGAPGTAAPMLKQDGRRFCAA